VLLNLGYLGDRLRPARRRSHAAGWRAGRRHQRRPAPRTARADVVVVSSAVRPDNPEIAVARARNIPVIPRAEMLAS
jgi:UDP-N-acetylmuramate--alanine ligase